MPYFSIRGGSDLPIVIAEVTDRKPKNPDRSGFQIGFITEVNESEAEGARHVIRILDEQMGTATKASGVYQASYGEVRRRFDDIVREHAELSKHGWAVRIAAGAAAIALLALMCALAVPITISWMVICAFKKESGIMAMAETYVVFSLFDWRPLIHKLGRIARGR